jgi:hypothetical protein
MTADVRKGMPDPRIEEEEFDRTFSRAVLRPYNLSVEWLSAREAILEAAARHRDSSSASRILIINGSPRSEHNLPRGNVENLSSCRTGMTRS